MPFVKVWYDQRADNLTKEGMQKGIEGASAVILFLSSGVMERPFCIFEIREALKLGKPLLLVHESDPVSRLRKTP
jgi:hypothetical protein